MTFLHAVAKPDELPEWGEAEIAELLRAQGLQAFVPCPGNEASPTPAPGEPQVQASLLRFPGGVLKLSRVRYSGAGSTRYVVAVDVHDYRAAVMDARIVQDAYLRLAAALREYVSCQGALAEIEVACCPSQGTAFLSVEKLDAAPADETLRAFLMRYFGAGRAQADLHRAFGEASIAFARSAVPAIVAAIAM